MLSLINFTFHLTLLRRLKKGGEIARMPEIAYAYKI
jgi:hypothetical protein